MDHRTRAAGTLVPPRCLGRSSGTLSWSSLSDAPSDLASGGEDPEIRKRKSEKITRRETKSGPRHWKNYSDRIIWAVDNKRLERGHTKLSRAATPVLLSAIDSFVSAKVMVPRPLEQTLVEGSGQQPSNISLASYIKKKSQSFVADSLGAHLDRWGGDPEPHLGGTRTRTTARRTP